MSKKFPYGYDVNVYLEKAFERLKELYPWVEKNMLREGWSYTIEKEGQRYQYVAYFKWNNNDVDRYVIKGDCEDFIQHFISDHETWVQWKNDVKEKLSVKGLIPPGTCIRGWYMECYEFRSHVMGGYSVYLQGGDRSAGSSRTIFIPPAYFNLSWDEFLDKYEELVPPGAFYLGKDELKDATGLKAFLGF